MSVDSIRDYHKALRRVMQLWGAGPDGEGELRALTKAIETYQARMWPGRWPPVPDVSPHWRETF